MKRKALSAVVILALTTMISNCVFAQSSQLSQTQDNKVQLQKKVNQLDTQVNSVISKINQNKADMNKINQNIKNTEKKLKYAKDKSKAQKKVFDSRLRAMYMSGTDGYIELLLSSNSFEDFLSRVDTVSRIIKFDKGIMDKLKKNEQTIDSEKKNLVYQNTKLQTLRNGNEKILSKLNSDIATQKNLLAKTSAKEKELLAKEEEQNSRQVAFNSAHSSGAVLSRGGSVSSASKVIAVNATAYSDDGLTATGAHTSQGIIAVDPRVIPLGSRVYVEGYGYAVAADTGGAIIGNRIDVFIPSESGARNWGMRLVNVYILN